eukprot:2453713-Pyramimonas_sp.AAC.1
MASSRPWSSPPPQSLQAGAPSRSTAAQPNVQEWCLRRASFQGPPARQGPRARRKLQERRPRPWPSARARWSTAGTAGTSRSW